MQPTSFDLQAMFASIMMSQVFMVLEDWKHQSLIMAAEDPERFKKLGSARGVFVSRIQSAHIGLVAEYAKQCVKRLCPPENEAREQLVLEINRFLKGEQTSWTLPLQRMADFGITDAKEVSEADLVWFRDWYARLQAGLQHTEPLSEPVSSYVDTGIVATKEKESPVDRRAASVADDPNDAADWRKQIAFDPAADVAGGMVRGLGERDSASFHSIYGKVGAHYNIYQLHGGVETLRHHFPDAEANPWNFVLFSTCGMHGTYTTIEDIERELTKSGDAFAESVLDRDGHRNRLTVLIVQPRLVCLRFGEVEITPADIPFLKKLRDSSYEACNRIGRADFRDWVRSVLGEVHSMHLPPRPAHLTND